MVHLNYGKYKSPIVEFFSQKIVTHVLVWTFVLFSFVIWDMNNNGHDFFFAFSNEIINLFFIGILIYLNLLYLIPNYLTEKRFSSYIGLLLFASIIITPIKIIILYFKFSNFPSMQAKLVEDKDFYFVTTFVVGLISTLGKIVLDWWQHLRVKKELETQTMQSELRFLKSQINPHFLFNTLNNLYALTLKKSDKAPEIVIKLSEMMRYMLYECNEKQVLLSKEINYIRNYLDLERLRQGKNIEINFDVEGSISEQQIAPLMFIPFLENSFKHGLNNHISQGFVNIKLAVSDHLVYFFIENSKPSNSPTPNPNRKSGGIGLVNVKRRLNILYPNNYELDISNNPKSYAVTLNINLN